MPDNKRYNAAAESEYDFSLSRDRQVAVEIVADGYSKGGIDVLIGFDESGAVCGIEFVAQMRAAEPQPCI